jgi:aerobic carbon-monoxide dehydrogenase large subunit
VGAYFTSERQAQPSTAALGCLASTYTIPAIYAQVTGIFTNTMMMAFYRGGGRPEPLYAIETLLDKAARKLGMDGVELRRRNTVSASAMPYRTAMGQVYDCGDFEKNLEDALKIADYDGLEARRRDARARGKVLGFGVSNTVAPSGGFGFEHAEIRFDPSGAVTMLMGSKDQGQGHETTFKQVLADKLGVDPNTARYIDGDTDLVAAGTGSFGSRTAILAGSAVVTAAQKLIEKGRKIAAHALEAAEGDIEFKDGAFGVVGTDKKIGLAEVAKLSYVAGKIPKGMEPGFSANALYESPSGGTWPNGAHTVELEIDLETGHLEMTRYSAVDDVGVVLNPLLFHGQIYGGIVQGAGQAMMEHMVYEEGTGQVLTGSFMDYAMPRASDFCHFEITNNVVPTTRNPLGVKGAGESGTCGAIPALMNAVNDALASIGAPEVEMPATAEKVWQAVRQAKRAAA